MTEVLDEDKKFDDECDIDWEVYSLIISGSLRRKYSSILFPTLKYIQKVIILQNTFCVEWTDQDSSKILVGTVTKVIARNKYFFYFLVNVSSFE